MANPELSQAAHNEIDRLDFKEIAVWNLEAALKAACLAGMVDHHRC